MKKYTVNYFVTAKYMFRFAAIITFFYSEQIIRKDSRSCEDTIL